MENGIRFQNILQQVTLPQVNNVFEVHYYYYYYYCVAFDISFGLVSTLPCFWGSVFMFLLILLTAMSPSQQQSASITASTTGYEIPARLRTLHNLVIQYASQGRYEVRA